MLVRLRVPTGNERGPAYAEQALDVAYSLLKAGESLTLGFTRHDDGVCLFCQGTDSVPSFVQGLHAFYPTTEITTIDRSALEVCDSWKEVTAYLSLKSDIFPIRRHTEFADDVSREFADPPSVP